MSKLEFHRIVYEKYGTSIIIVEGASLKLEKCEILQKEETEYDYQKAVLKLSPEKVIKMTKIEKEVNKHLEKEGLPHIKLVYGNRVYPKINIDGPKTVRLISVWINAEKKPFPRLWLEKSNAIIILV